VRAHARRLPDYACRDSHIIPHSDEQPFRLCGSRCIVLRDAAINFRIYPCACTRRASSSPSSFFAPGIDLSIVVRLSTAKATGIPREGTEGSSCLHCGQGRTRRVMIRVIWGTRTWSGRRNGNARFAASILIIKSIARRHAALRTLFVVDL